jgi:hypothetical protein
LIQVEFATALGIICKLGVREEVEDLIEGVAKGQRGIGGIRVVVKDGCNHLVRVTPDKIILGYYAAADAKKLFSVFLVKEYSFRVTG